MLPVKRLCDLRPLPPLLKKDAGKEKAAEEGKKEPFECPVCMRESQNKTRVLFCMHEFCVECAETLFFKANDPLDFDGNFRPIRLEPNYTPCPLCRSPIKSYTAIVHM